MEWNEACAGSPQAKALRGRIPPCKAKIAGQMRPGVEVDRVSRLEPLSRERVARWPDPAKRRRKFVEEFADAESDAESEEAEADVSGSPEAAAPPSESAAEDELRGHGFDALA